jgi:hypothetical protein
MNQISSPTEIFICVAAAKGEYRNNKSTKRSTVTSSYPIGRNWYSILLLTIQGFASHLRRVQAPFASLIHNNEVTVPFRSIRHVTRHRPQCCVKNWPLSQVTKASVEEVKRVTVPKSQKLAQKHSIFVYFALRGLQLPLTGHKTLETANFGIVRCRNFRSVTVTGHLCRSVELVQRVTVTGVCRIE